MKRTESPTGAAKPSPNVDRKPTNPAHGVTVKPGKEGLRFGPVVTGQVALGKDGCGY